MDRRRPELPEVFLGRDAVSAGALTAQQLRGPIVRRLYTGVYSPRGVPETHELRCRAAALLSPDGLVITGRSAAVLRGVPLARPADPVEVRSLPGHRVNRRPGLAVRRGLIRRDDHEWVGRVRVATPLRTAFDVISVRPLAEAVADLDQLLRAGVVRDTNLGAALRLSHENGVVQARRVLELADARAESPPESVVRVVLALAGIVGEPQLVVHDHAGFVARVDLGFERERLAVEYDGAWHSDRFALTRDRDRLNRLQRSGWEVVSVTASMLRRPSDVVDLVAAALARRRRLLAA
ncbi:DUF559 domain-containing protein [Rhodococcus aerolatus]